MSWGLVTSRIHFDFGSHLENDHEDCVSIEGLYVSRIHENCWNMGLDNVESMDIAMRSLSSKSLK